MNPGENCVSCLQGEVSNNYSSACIPCSKGKYSSLGLGNLRQVPQSRKHNLVLETLG